MKIVNLKTRPTVINALARCHFLEWGDLYPGSTEKEFRMDLQASVHSDRVPQTWVLVDNERLCGSVSILEQDLPSHPELSPWLANVFVAAPFRGRGHGQQLVQVAICFARQQRLGPLFLYTPDQTAFYQKLGWDVVQEEVYQGRKIVLMSGANFSTNTLWGGFPTS